MIKKDFLRVSHRGFGQKAEFRYALKNGKHYVFNQLTGFELGLEKGANALEIDLHRTSDGHIVTAHGIPFSKKLTLTLQQFLDKNPEAMTFLELIDWLYHQKINIYLYLELKVEIWIKEIVNIIEQFALQNNDKSVEIIDYLYNHIILYAENNNYLANLLKEKKELQLLTLELKICAVTNSLLSRRAIDYYAALGTSNCKLYGVEQGMFIWGNPLILNLLKVSPIRINYFSNLSQLVEYTHSKEMIFIVGTVDDPYWIVKFIDSGVDGIVPNNPDCFFRNKIKGKVNEGYIPFSMRKRIVTV